MASPAYYVNYLSHVNSYHFWSHTPPFTIFPRDASGKPGSQYPPGEPLHVTSAINICRAMLHHQRVRDAFKTVAVRYRAGGPNSGYFNPEQATNTFIGKILATFPLVFLDYSLKNPDHKGFHTRRPWDGNFEPGHQAISINGKNTDHMSTAFEDGTHPHVFRAFLFMTVNTFLHEIGHVFVTYLTNGRQLTPRQINAPTLSVPGGDGEAGRALEHLIFDGTINYFQEPISGTPDGQWGTAYLQKSSGAYYRILQKTIDSTTSSEFKFPYDHEESAEDSRKLKLLGEGFDPDTYTDPLERKEVAHLLNAPAMGL